MAGYLAMQMKKGKLNYNVIVKKFPQFKEDIDLILATDGYIVNVDGTVVKDTTVTNVEE